MDDERFFFCSNADCDEFVGGTITGQTEIRERTDINGDLREVWNIHLGVVPFREKLNILLLHSQLLRDLADAEEDLIE